MRAKSLLSYPTLCDSRDRSQPGSSVPGDSPAKNTGVGCHALLQRIFPTRGLNPHLLTPAWQGVLYHESHLRCVLCLVAGSGLTLRDPMDCSPPGSSVHGILQGRVLEWVSMPSSSGSSWPRDRTQISHITGGFFTVWATREAPCQLGSPKY